MNDKNTTLLMVEHLRKIYSTRFGGNQVEALKDVSFDVEQGEFIAVMGESGSGKTTLLNLLATLDRPTEGKILLAGKDITRIQDSNISRFRRENLGFVFQDFNLLDTFSLRDNIYLPLVLSNTPKKEMESRLVQNAKGLSNICILSTAVMVIATTTLALYVGQKEMVSFRFPMETKISVSDIAQGQPPLPQLVHETAGQYGMVISREADYNVTWIGGVYKDNTFLVYEPEKFPPDITCGIYLITWEDYCRMEGGAEPLEADEVFVFSSSKDLGVSEISFDSLKYRVKTELSDIVIQSKSVLAAETKYFFICPTQKEIGNILAELSPAENKLEQTYSMMFDAEGEREAEFNAALRNQLVSNYAGATYENAEIERESNNFTFGGFLFIGLLLSLLFMIFLTLVIYYKQITEGYSDRCHFEVMQKIGLDRNEVSAIVHKEIRIMFFLPLLVAVIHLVASLYAVAMLLSVFGLTNVWVLVLCAGTIFLVFVLIYVVMYFSTARTYCKIVMR